MKGGGKRAHASIAKEVIGPPRLTTRRVKPVTSDVAGRRAMEWGSGRRDDSTSAGAIAGLRRASDSLEPKSCPRPSLPRLNMRMLEGSGSYQHRRSMMEEEGGGREGVAMQWM